MIECFRPNRADWRSTRKPFQWADYELACGEGAKRFESGTINVYGIAALEGSLALLLEAGPKAIERRVLAARAAAGLVERGF